MNFRDSSIAVHYGRRLVVGVDSSHGVRLSGGSTGGVVEAIGDDANISLLVRSKGTGETEVGSTAGLLRLNCTSVQVGSRSTTAITYIQRYLVQFTEPTLSSGPANAYSTFTVTGVTTNANYIFTPRLTLKAGYAIGDVRCSTADELSILWTNNSADTNSGSSNRGTLLQFAY